MADWTNQSNDSLLPGEPWTSAKAIASFENPVAIAEGAEGAPVVEYGFHPYNLGVAGSSEDGLIYDVAVSGTVPSSGLETPVLVRGYDYRIFLLGFAINYITIRGVTDGTYGAFFGFDLVSSGAIDFVRGPEGSCLYKVFSAGVSESTLGTRTPAQDFDRINLQNFNSGAGGFIPITAGKVYLYKRYTGKPKV